MQTVTEMKWQGAQSTYKADVPHILRLGFKFHSHRKAVLAPGPLKDGAESSFPHLLADGDGIFPANVVY